MMSLYEAIGASIKAEKVEGSTTCLTSLGIVLNITSMKPSGSSKCKASLLTAICSFCTLNARNDSCLLASSPLPAK